MGCGLSSFDEPAAYRGQSGAASQWWADRYFESSRFWRAFHARNRLTVWRINSGFCLISRPVRQALAFDTFHRKHRPFPIGNAEARPVIVAKFKFTEIAL
jgi:hypothetical protein